MDFLAAIKNLADVMRREREKSFSKQQMFAYRSGIDRSHYNCIERGVCDIQLSTLLKICRCLRITPWQLLEMAWKDKFTFEEDS